MYKKTLAEILKWLYLNDGGYNNKIEWRKEFIKTLEDELFHLENKLIQK